MESSRSFPTPYQLRLGLFFAIPVAMFAGSALGPTMLARAEYVPSTAFTAGHVLTAAELSGEFQRIAQHLGDPDCPMGYIKDPAGAGPGGSTLCKNGEDEIVKVGRGASAFWIDRYEASVWSESGGAGTQLNGAADNGANFPGFPKNGQVTQPMFALSKTGVTPTRFVTWFQASEACAASGKRLMKRDEWFRAVRNTADPGVSDGMLGDCRTNSTAPRTTGAGTLCVSDWGAQDMIGNLWEWTDEWYAGLSSAGPSCTGALCPATPWPAEYKGDGTWQIDSFAQDGTTYKQGLPAAAFRGGSWSEGTGAGAYTLYLAYAPSASGNTIGFRCVVPK